MDLERGKVYTVERGATKMRAGQGLGAGLGVVIKHFVDAWTKKLDQPNQTSGVFTVQYPEEQLPLAEAYRNFPILLYDDANGQELCTSCFQCQRVCPPQVIHMTQAKDPATGKAVPAVSEFIIEYDACMSCGLCAEVCPFDAIKMDHNFELATDYHPGLTVDREGLDRPISYYENIAPNFWQEVRDNALKKLGANVKRRSGTIGVAPQMVDVVDQGSGAGSQGLKTAEDREKTKQGEDETGRRGEEETSFQPAVSSLQLPTSSVDDKAARLAAIRARNAAKERNQEAAEAGNGGESGLGKSLEPAEGTEPPSIAAPADDKAARLAAIRARNAAKKADQQSDEANE